MSDEEAYRKFVAPALTDLDDPSTIHGMDHACESIARAIRDRETIIIYGDYDIDDATSIVMLQMVLRARRGRGLPMEQVNREPIDIRVKRNSPFPRNRSLSKEPRSSSRTKRSHGYAISWWACTRRRSR